MPYGDWIAYEPAVVIGLAVLFELVGGVVPLRRRRNLDVAAMLWLTISVMLFARHYVDLSVLVALPALGLLLVRCLAVGAPPPEPSQISVRC